MADVLATLEAQLAEAKTALTPLAQTEAAALAAAASATAARVGQEVQVAAVSAAHVAAKARLLGSHAVTAVEGEASKAASAVGSGASNAWKWAISHSWVGGLAAAAGYGVKWMGWL